VVLVDVAFDVAVVPVGVLWCAGGEQDGDRDVEGTGNLACPLRPHVKASRYHRVGIIATLALQTLVVL
jgi:hypothetical protein